MNEQQMRELPATGARGVCDLCGHVAFDRAPLGVPIGPTRFLATAACGSCRAAYQATGVLPFGLMHCSAVLTDEDVTDDLHARGYCDAAGHWPTPGTTA